MRKGAAVFQGLIFRLGVAFLAFSTGILAVSLWLYHRHAIDMSRIAQSQQPAGEEPEANRTSGTKWIYLATPHPVHDNAPALASMIALYADGKWLQTYVWVERENGRLKLSEFNQASVASGTWKQSTNGKLEVIIDDCWSDIESLPLDGGHKVEYPVTTHWSLKNGMPGQASSILRTIHEELRLLLRDQLAVNNIDVLLDAYRTVENKSDIVTRKCLEEDLDIFTK